MPSRREFLVAAAAVVVSRRALLAETPASVITVYKDPNCGCCMKWIEHLSKAGFVVMPKDMTNMDEVKSNMRVPKQLQSCHTGVVDKYVIEGHVPADVIKKFLAEKPTDLGLAVPGMPSGSPGMEGGRVDKYDIIAFTGAGKTRVYAKR
jgi:hypothetical protein